MRFLAVSVLSSLGLDLDVIALRLQVVDAGGKSTNAVLAVCRQLIDRADFLQVSNEYLALCQFDLVRLRIRFSELSAEVILRPALLTHGF